MLNYSNPIPDIDDPSACGVHVDESGELLVKVDADRRIRVEPIY
jgi:hypothetical protein